MGNIIGGIMSKDPDDLFSYNTPKVVKVRDRRLGIPYYCFMICIFCYICYTVIANQRYLNTEEPGGGSIRTTLKVYDFEEEYEPVQMGTKEIKWIYWNAPQIVYPAGQDGSMFITTRVTESNLVYKKGNDFNESECNPFLPTKRSCRQTSVNPTTYYVADIESMTIMVEHTIRGNLLDITEVNKNLYGELLDEKDNVVWRFFPKDTKENTIKKGANYTIREEGIPGDIFSVGTLLKASGFSLDDPNNGDETYRYSGCVIVIIIEYNNNHEKIQYKYKPTLIKNAEMKVLELVNDINYVNKNILPTFTDNGLDNPNESVGWLEYNRHGIEIKFVQLGDIGVFDFMALCMNLVASIAMLSVASSVVESLMLYILPEKGIYRRFKYELTEDFSDIRDHNKLEKKELKEREKEISEKSGQA
ncbi:hypothetical protein BCR32DRAFT_264826 [Anaeromyces robustus]|uniref:Uncharacterized protein n=1 Tax=Anaeromyces robustus TaxID=1754192 RepID=A0A1Y1XLR9_9FUNG|nr:hypothetical protein BCR32DRAFT_264826 [Anaeromyces robustus]|eukprot:ORX86671.1 hypothetical protein BCR32DRAFT_264826 [Anaeromyces robustus]